MTPTKIVFNRLICNCQQCGNVWVAETLEKPKRCGACKSVLWDREPQPRGPKPAIKCKHCSEEIKRDEDGDWMDRETGTFCEGTQRKHAPVKRKGQ